jgi:hypothetical protein
MDPIKLESRVAFRKNSCCVFMNSIYAELVGQVLEGVWMIFLLKSQILGLREVKITFPREEVSRGE